MTLDRLYRITQVPECGHVRLVTECDYCWDRAFRAMRLEHAEDEKIAAQSWQNVRDGIAWSRSFNARGCPCCGYVIG